jgi:hypothetical protein
VFLFCFSSSMLPVSLDCSFLLPLWYVCFNIYIHCIRLETDCFNERFM